MLNPFSAFLASLDEKSAEAAYTWLDGNPDAVADMMEEIAAKHSAAFVRSGFFSRPADKSVVEPDITQGTIK